MTEQFSDSNYACSPNTTTARIQASKWYLVQLGYVKIHKHLFFFTN